VGKVDPVKPVVGNRKSGKSDQNKMIRFEVDLLVSSL
jgi:hypothetical protein